MEAGEKQKMMRALPGKQFNKAAAVPGTTGRNKSSQKHQHSDGGLIILAEQPQGDSLTFLWRSPPPNRPPPKLGGQPAPHLRTQRRTQVRLANQQYLSGKRRVISKSAVLSPWRDPTRPTTSATTGWQNCTHTYTHISGH